MREREGVREGVREEGKEGVRVRERKGGREGVRSDIDYGTMQKLDFIKITG